MKELSIYSPSNVAINYQLAPMMERSLAFIIDLVIILLIGQLFIWTIGSLLLKIIGDDHFLNIFVFYFSQIIILFSYFALAEYLMQGTTVGKRLMGLRTIRIDGETPSFETFGIRSAMLFLDFLLGFGPIGFLSAASSPMRQRVGDRIAQTVVIRTNPRTFYQLQDILNIRTIEDHVVTYENATNLSIEQALMLKELIVTSESKSNASVNQLVVDAAKRLAILVELEKVPQPPLEFLRQVLRDYIVLTR